MTCSSIFGKEPESFLKRNVKFAFLKQSTTSQPYNLYLLTCFKKQSTDIPLFSFIIFKKVLLI